MADWLVRLTNNQRNWGFGLCFLYLRNVKGFKWNHIRCDNGPEYISAVTLAWDAKRGIRIDFIQLGQPQQNAYVERYNRTVRYDWLAHHLLETLDVIQDFATRWLWTYSHDRPNMALGGITPKQKLALAA